MDLADDIMEWLTAGHTPLAQGDDSGNEKDDEDWVPDAFRFEANHGFALPARAKRSDGPLTAEATLCIDDTINHHFEEAADHMGVSCKRCKHCILWTRDFPSNQSSRQPICKRIRTLVETHAAEISHVEHIAPKPTIAPFSKNCKAHRQEMQQECRRLGFKVNTRTSTARMVRMLSKVQEPVNLSKFDVKACLTPSDFSFKPAVVPISPVKERDAADDLAHAVQKCMEQIAKMRLDHTQEMQKIQGELYHLRNGMHSVLGLCEKACLQFGNVLDEQASKHQLYRVNQIELCSELRNTRAGLEEFFRKK